MQTSQLSILIMDDNAMHGEALHNQLAALGHQSRFVFDAESAWKSLQVEEYDVLITDMVVSVKSDTENYGKGGLTLISRVRYKSNTEHLQKMPIIAITGSLDTYFANQLRMADALGADITLRKPIKLDELMDALEKVTSDE